jgi:hypothetical protein
MGHHFVNIRAATWERLRDLQQVYDLDVFRQTAKRSSDAAFEIRGLLDDAQVERLRADGYDVEITADAENMAEQRLKDVARRPAELSDDE